MTRPPGPARAQERCMIGTWWDRIQHLRIRRG